jgi:hypothetical protein
MGLLYDTLTGLAPEHDREMLDGYARYEAVLAESLNDAQMHVYADYLARTGEVRIFDEMMPSELAALSPEMAAVASIIMAGTDSTMENRRVAALLNQRGEEEVAPDLGHTDHALR